MFTMNTLYHELTKDDLAHLEKQRAFVHGFCAVNHLPSPARNASDFDLLQRIVDSGLIAKTETWRLQALGAVFGDALVGEASELHWMQVTDEWGTDPALIYGDTTLQLNPVTMISKRVEDGVTGDFVRSLGNTLLRHLSDEGRRASKR